MGISRTRPLTNIFLQCLLGLHVVLLKLVVELLECLKILDGDPHLFDFLGGQSGANHLYMEREFYLSEHEIPLSKLHEEVLGSKSIVELDFEIFYLHFGIGKLDQGRLVIR